MSDPNPEYYNQQTVVAYGDLGAGSLFIIYDPTRSAGDRDVNVLVSSLASALNAAYLKITQNLADLDDVPTARTNLGLGGLAILGPADLESGGSDELEIALSQIPSINSQASTFLGAGTVLAQQQALDLEPGVDVQAQDALLQTIADAASFDAAGLVAKSGNQTGIAGTKEFLGLLTLVAGLRAQVPADFWSGSAPAIFTPQGGFSTMGSYAMDFFSNGYRNNSTLWTSLAQNGYLGAGVLSFKPTDGSILFCTSDNWPTGSAYIPPTRIKVRGDNGNVRIGAGGSEDGKLNVQGTQKISSWLQTIGTTVALLDSSAPDGAWDFATNGRKPGEGASSGTGVPVFRDGGVWYSLADWITVAA